MSGEWLAFLLIFGVHIADLKRNHFHNVKQKKRTVGEIFIFMGERVTDSLKKRSFPPVSFLYEGQAKNSYEA